MSLHPFIRTDANNYAIDLQTQARTAVYGIVAPSNVTTLAVGDIVTINNIQEAVNALGSDVSKGNYAMKLIEYIFSLSSASKIYYCYPGKNTSSATTTTINNVGGHSTGESIITVTSSAGFTIDENIIIDTGENEETRRILNIVGNDIYIFPLAKDHANGVAVTELTAYATANLATCRTALRNYKFSFYTEDSYGTTLWGDLKTWLHDRAESELFTRAFIGNKSGQTKAGHITDAQTINSEYIRPVYGNIQYQDDIYEGNFVNGVSIVIYAQEYVKNKLRNNVVISCNDVILKNIDAVYDSEDFSEILIPEANTLIDGNVSAIADKYVLGTQAVRFHKVVTSYNKDGSLLPSTTFSNIVDNEVDIYLREYASQLTADYLADRVLSDVKIPMTNKRSDLDDLQGYLQGKLNELGFLNNDVNPVICLVSYDNLNDQIKIEITYTAVKSGDRVLITIYKQPNL